jgi:uncharacterized tellurite resistance protein B-like protein
MSPLSYQAIEPLVQSTSTSGRTVQVLFACPLSKMEVSSQHTLPRAPAKGAVAQQIERSVLYTIQREAYTLIRSLFGNNVLGRAAGNMAKQTVRQVASSSQISTEDMQEAIIQAFYRVQSRFVWNKDHWVSAQAAHSILSPFEQQLAEAPIVHKYDLHILARMMAELIQADGSVNDREIFLFNDLVPAELGTFSSFSTFSMLNENELDQCSVGDVRASLLMTVWLLALSDGHLANEERQRINAFANGLKLNRAQLQRAQEHAEAQALEGFLDQIHSRGAASSRAQENLIHFAEQMGISKARTLHLDAAYQRRKLS